ncbi:MAG: sigma-54 interaction domain-containing protein [Desulfovibrionaceae bacterium]
MEQREPEGRTKADSGGKTRRTPTDLAAALLHGVFDAPVAFAPLLDEIPMGVLLVTPDRRIVAMNRGAEALTGFSSAEARGVPCRHVMRNSVCLGKCPAMAQPGATWPAHCDGDVLTRDRRHAPVRMTMAPLLDPRGRVVGYIEALEDLRQATTGEDAIAHAFGSRGLLGASEAMHKLFTLSSAIALTDSAVLITGETGTGKDVIAEAIHRASPRAKGAFVKVNCGALPETLLESELFGHRKGAFTGATENKPGRIRLAHQGTLFLTEIGDLPLPLQVKLLSFLDDKVIHPLGESHGVHVDVRLIAATHRNLEAMVREGRFRQDLLFRLNVVRLRVPPLREREGDARLLLDHFLHQFSAGFGKQMRGFSETALDALLHYDYPGNVRELRNIVEYAVNVCPGGCVGTEHLPAYLFEPRPAPEAEPPVSIVPDRQAAAQAEPGQGQPAPSHPAPHGDSTWSGVERAMILDALVQARGRRAKAAGILGMSRSTLWRKMREYGLEAGGSTASAPSRKER